MIERVATCLNSSTRPSTYKASRAVRDRRLHSSFWRHGASDLQLPFWWDTMVGPLVKDMSMRLQDRGQRPPECDKMGILEFLYPKKTVAYLNQLSEMRQDYLARKQSHFKASRNTRQFSTTFSSREIKASTEEDDLNDLDQSSEDAVTQMPIDHTNVASLLDDSEAELGPALKQFWSHVNGQIPESTDEASFERAWRLYNKLDPTQTSPPEIKMLLLNYLSFSDRHADRVRTGFLANSLDGRSSFWAVIVSNLSMGSIESAVHAHDRAIREGVTSYIGSDVILAHAIRNEEWNLALQISATVVGNIADPSDKQGIQNTLYDLWKLVMKLPGLPRYAVDYLHYAHKRLNVNFPIVRAFIHHFVSAALSQCPEPNVSSDSILNALQDYCLDKAPIFEMAIKRLVDNITAEERVLPGQLDLLKKIWEAYRRSCDIQQIRLDMLLELIGTVSSPRVSSLVSEAQQNSWIEQLVHDYSLDTVLPALANHRVPRLRIRRLPYKTQVSLMRMYSLRGNVAQVLRIEECLGQSISQLTASSNRSNSHPTQDIRRACALIRVYAVRGDQLNAERQFDQLRPRHYRHRAVWMALLDVYVKSKNVGKAFDCAFNRMPAAGIPPDRQTFRALFIICRDSGDPTALNSLLKLAKKQNVDLGASSSFVAVLEHLKNRDFTAAEEIAHMLTESKSGKEITPDSRHVWNTILYSAGKARDAVAVDGILTLMHDRRIAIEMDTFEAIVLMLVRSHQTDRAFHIVQEVMPLNGFTPNEKIYGLLVEGYANENLYAVAIQQFDEMVERGLKPTSIARADYLASKAILGRTDPMFNDKIFSELEYAISHPEDTTWSRGAPPIWFSSPTDQYLAALIDRFGEVGDEGMVGRLYSRYLQSLNNPVGEGADSSLEMSRGPSLGVLRSLMKACLQLGKHNLVVMLWNQGVSVLTQAIRKWNASISTLEKMTLDGAPVGYDSAEVTSASSENTNFSLPSIIAFHQDSPAPSDLDISPLFEVIPESFGHLHSPLLLQYMSSLALQGKFDTIISTVASLTSAGFRHSNRAWNEYVLHLCSSPSMKHVIAGFIGCEQHLIQNYRPWVQNLDSKARMRFNVEEKQNWVPGVLRPEHRTLFVLKSIAHVGKTKTTLVEAEDYGMGTGHVMLIDVLNKVVPKTMEAMKSWVPLRKGSERYASLPKWVQIKDQDSRKRFAALEKARIKQQESTALDGTVAGDDADEHCPKEDVEQLIATYADLDEDTVSR